MFSYQERRKVYPAAISLHCQKLGDLTDASSSIPSKRFLLWSPLVQRCIVQDALRIDAHLARSDLAMAGFPIFGCCTVRK